MSHRTPARARRRLRKLLTQRDVPDLGDCEDVADFFSRIATDASDSEGEEGANARVTLAQDFRGAGNRKGDQSTIKLQEARVRSSETRATRLCGLAVSALRAAAAAALCAWYEHLISSPRVRLSSLRLAPGLTSR